MTTADAIPERVDLDLHGVDIPHLTEWLGAWAIHPEFMGSALNVLQTFDLRAHMKDGPPDVNAQRGRTVKAREERTFARIDLSGPLTKHVSSLSSGTSTVVARQEIRAAAANPEIDGILLVIDSPGGTVAGTQDLAMDVAAARDRKPVVALVEDLGASAAYWVASQASHVMVNGTGLLGSIGTFAVLHDMEGMAGQLGIKVHVISAGEFKGAGVPGTKVTEAQLADVQRLVDTLNDEFLQAVASGRGLDLDAVKTLADGRVHVGPAAVDLRLADSVGGIDQAVAQLQELAGASPAAAAAKQEGATMSTNETAAASVEQIQAACPGASADFVLAQLTAGATVEQAKDAHIAAQAAAITARDAELEEARNAATAAREASPGVPTVTDVPAGNTAAEERGNAVETFQGRVAELRGKGLTQRAATARAVREDPELHRAMLAEHNENNGRPGVVV